MALRSKILAVFLVVALLPAVITAVLDSRRLERLADDLTARNKDVLSRQALSTMERIAIDYARLLDRETERVRTLVSLQAELAERLLANDVPADRPVYFDADFDAGLAALALESAEAIGGPNSTDRQHTPLAVSWRHQVFHHPQTLNREQATREASVLAPMITLYRKVRDETERFIRWHYVVLDDGLSATYPGHGHYPANFDPRARPWYESQKRTPGFRWYRPHADAATGALVINSTMPLFNAAGKFVGITGIDVDLSASFAALALPAWLRDGSELLQVIAARPPQVREPDILVLARQHAAHNPGDWAVVPELESLILDRARDTEALRNALLAGENGHLRAAVNGRECFVLYQQFGRDSAYLLVVVPVQTATRAALEAGDYAASITAEQIGTLLRFLLAASTLVIIVALVASRHLTRPLEQLKLAFERLANGDFNARAEIATGDELEALGTTFNAMVPQLREHQRVGESLSLAREIQQKLLPDEAPDIRGYDIAGRSIYSEQTGGDYFDYVPLDAGAGNRCGIVVADVSGHGVASSLLMTSTRALLHGGRDRGLSPGELLGYVNEKLVEDVTRGHFVTLFILVVDAGHARLEWASAGHEAAAHYVAATGMVGELGSDDIPLGIDAQWKFSTSAGTALEVGDVVVLGTDGIWEAANERGERFGKQRLHDYIAAHANASATELCHGLTVVLARFRGPQAQHDDVTIVVVKRVATT